MTLIALAMLVIPTVMLSGSTIESSQTLAEQMEAGTLSIPPPSDKVESWPLVGEKLHRAWSLASNNLSAALSKYKDQLTEFAKFVLSVAAGASDSFLKPLLLGRGLDIPMLVILLGAIGGMILSGIIGLFVGAVVLAVGYKLFMVWMNEDIDAVRDVPRVTPVE